MVDQIPDGAITDIMKITPGMMVKVKEDPILHRCRYNDVHYEGCDDDGWGLTLEHEPRMEYYDDRSGRYHPTATYDFAHVNSVEYALPPIPPGELAIVRRDGSITLVDVDTRWNGRGEEL